ncbi:DNA-directed RNA polymerase subunit alpha [Candidatus Parcubacteria bacterium]|nr:DNA-directed RNA polymerase subunit alpha [Candidatus Parcubacteria bacterium]
MTPITLPFKPRITSIDSNKGTFEIDALSPGYGQTLGNSLRRVLLSSLPGAAITSIRIAGVDHEFSTIANVYDNVVDILLNLKQVRVSLQDDEPQLMTLSVKGEREVTAGMIKAPSQVTIVNPDAYIATLTDKKAELNIEMTVERGMGYVPVSERREKEKVPIGTIALDAIFSPVRRVNYTVEDMRVGDRTDFNKLRLEIETDGTLSPADALTSATKILAAQFQALAEIEPLPTETEVSDTDTETPLKAPTILDDEMKTKVEDLGLPTRFTKTLIKGGIRTLAGLANKSEEQLLAIEGLGEKGIKEIRKVIGQYGLTLKKSEE